MSSYCALGEKVLQMALVLEKRLEYCIVALFSGEKFCVLTTYRSGTG